MSLRVNVYRLKGSSRSQRIIPSVCEGINACGDRVQLLDSTTPPASCPADVAVFYGYEKGTPEIMEHYKSVGRTAVFIDLGYWGRHDKGRWRGFHKVTINSRHPTAYIRRLYGLEYERERDLPVRIHPWRKSGNHVLLVGMSEKAANTVGLEAQEWEKKTIEALKRYTDREIVYRPKPSWKGARPIEGTTYHRMENLMPSLRNCHAVVSRHSNVCIDALQHGIPVFSEDGAAYHMSAHDLSKIETPYFPENREAFMKAVGLCQFNVQEMRNGFMWRFFKEQKLVPYES